MIAHVDDDLRASQGVTPPCVHVYVWGCLLSLLATVALACGVAS